MKLLWIKEVIKIGVYLYFYKPCYDTECNFTGMFGFMGLKDKDEYLLSGVIKADNEFQAESRAREKEFKKIKKHFDYVTGVEITKVLNLY